MSSTRAPRAMRTPLALPDPRDTYRQDEEWCVVRTDGRWREIRFHDYAEIFAVPGLYERLFYEILECTSPATIRSLMEESLEAADQDPAQLRALDLGAGNGIMGEELRDMGADVVVGADIIPEAAEAAARDRPEVYEDYVVADMTDLSPAERSSLEEHSFTCLTCVAALGFADIPPEAFLTAFNLLETGGWVGFNLNEDFLDGEDRSGFSELIAGAIEDGVLELTRQRRYQHRLGTDGQPIHYIALVGQKRGDLAAA